jgi:catechol 2,3-dioxygenase-like lactoylglutathione lyase family enzyme
MNSIATFKNIVLFVKDIAVSKQFYTEILDQQVEYDFGNTIGFKGGIALWKIQKGHEIEGLLDDEKITSSGFEVYFETENIHEVVKKIDLHHIKLLHPLKTEQWGQQTVRFFDPDGHLIEIGESLQTFIRRIYEETGSIGKTSQKTGVPEDMIMEMIED